MLTIQFEDEHEFAILIMLLVRRVILNSPRPIPTNDAGRATVLSEVQGLLRFMGFEEGPYGDFEDVQRIIKESLDSSAVASPGYYTGVGLNYKLKT